MRLINVQAILDIEQGKVDPRVKIIQNFTDKKLRLTQYAILSHCWGEEEEEVLLKEVLSLAKMEKKDLTEIRQRPGYHKIVKTCEQALKDGFEWAWVDTCCIDKESSAELHDVQGSSLLEQEDCGQFGDMNDWPKWFSRGWTLQELIAPNEVLFFNRRWELLGKKSLLAPVLSRITDIPVEILQYGLGSNRPCAAQIMSWAAYRETTREEDQAYSLLGLFGVYMPMVYGEGKNAFQRLQLEILRTKNDHSIFAWHAKLGFGGNVLADSPAHFWNCKNTVRMDTEEYRETIKQMITEDEFQSITEEQLRTCSVTNGGIQIWLPVRQKDDLPIFEATLACRNNQGPCRIESALCKSQYHRYSAEASDYGPAKFRQIFLAYGDEINRDKATFQIETTFLYEDDFVQEKRRQVNNVTLDANHHRKIAYRKKSTDTYFEIFLGYFLGEPWAHLSFPNAMFRTWSSMPDQVSTLYSAAVGKTRNACCLVKHLHLPGTLSGIQLTYQRQPRPNSHLLILAVTPCRGQDCPSSSKWRAFDNIRICGKGKLSHLRTLLPNGPLYTLLIDGAPTTFMSTLEEPGFELGDYGFWDNGHFKRDGNIFKDHDGPHFSPIKQAVTDVLGNMDKVSFGSGDTTLVLRDSQSLSIPDDKDIKILLRALATTLKGKCLISTVVQCSQCWTEDSRQLHVSTPLCIPTQPLIWYEEGVNARPM